MKSEARGWLHRSRRKTDVRERGPLLEPTGCRIGCTENRRVDRNGKADRVSTYPDAIEGNDKGFGSDETPDKNELGVQNEQERSRQG
jgi:hypothetical protein